MFYTLASRIPLISTSKSKKFLLIFVVGSIAYVLLHYYLYSGERFDLLNKLRDYLYYIMALDLGVAYFLSKFSTDSEEDEREHRGGDITREEREEIERNLQELKRMQPNPAEIQRQKMLQMQYEQQQAKEREQKETKSNKEEKSQESPFMTREEVEESDKKENKSNKSKQKKSKDTTTSSSSTSEKKPKKITKKQTKAKTVDMEDDTNLPVYGMNN